LRRFFDASKKTTCRSFENRATSPRHANQRDRTDCRKSIERLLSEILRWLNESFSQLHAANGFGEEKAKTNEFTMTCRRRLSLPCSKNYHYYRRHRTECITIVCTLIWYSVRSKRPSGGAAPKRGHDTHGPRGCARRMRGTCART